ncbi:probable polygalacturonase At3g15720 [Vigna angularis]|uniref:probable polygalacturonase At3g15720 n=1 Tax=Phaseolus angularis TaxID=3914 RepID=UPI00080A78A9|nr:probable polygalacturonase At3g15720 [Vigna angularis]
MNYGAKGDGISDDAQAFLKAWQSSCGAQGMATLVIPANYRFLLSPLMLKGPCHASNIQIQIRGKVIAAEKNAWASYKYTWILISNVNGLTVDGSGGSLDGFGSSWWSCRNCPRPSVISFNSCNGLSVSSLNIINSPKAHININNCVGATFSAISIQSPGDTHNTDGIDVYASKNIWIKDSTIACGDDCIAISGGSSYVNVTGSACGPGHGISVGSLGNGNSNTVEQVHVRNCNFTNTQNGARIKTYADGSGYARGITFEEITLIQTRNPIIINQFYTNNGVSLKNGGVEVRGITFRGFHGTSMTGEAITLNCGPQGCFNITLDQINIASSQQGKPASCSCKNAHGTATSSVPNCPCLMP